MTTDQTILYLTVGLTVFFLATVLLYIAYSRNKINFRISKARLLKAYQEQREKNKYLALDYAQSEANGKSLNALLEQAGEQRKQLRKDFVEQSEIATQWRQKHDKLKESFDSQKDYMKRTAASWNKLSNEVAQLEAELDRGNEIISWLKADLQKAYTLLFVNENNIMELLAEGKFPNEKGIYRKNYISKNGESLPLGQYIDSLHDSLISQLELSAKPNSAEKIKELDHFFKNPFTEKKPKGWNLKVYPRDEKGRVRKASDFIHKEFEPKEGIIEVVTGAGKGPAETNHDNAVLEHIQEIITEQEGGIDWSKPQPFPKDYRIPKGIECVNLIQGTWGDFIVPELTKVATIESSFNPFVKRLDGKHRQNKVSVNYNDFADKCFKGIDLAPVNPTDHPLHPDFKDPDKQDPDPNSPNEIARNWDKLTPYPKGCIVPINEPSINVSSDNKLIKIGELGYLCQSKANYTKVWFYPIDSKLVQERTRRDYIECEVHNFAPTNPHHHPDHPFYGISKEQLILTPDGWELKEDEKFLSVNLSPYQNTFNIPNPDHF